MKNITPVLVFIAGLILLGRFAKGSAASTLQFHFAGIKFNYSGLTVLITIQVSVQNTSNQDLTINSLAGSLYANGEYIGNVSSFEKMTIPNNSERVYSVVLRTNITDAMNTLIDVYNGLDTSESANLRFTGNVNFENLQVPVDLSYKLYPAKMLT